MFLPAAAASRRLLLKGFSQMLVITRRRGERVFIGKDIEVVVTRVVDGSVRLAIQAPKDTPIVRSELVGKAVSK